MKKILVILPAYNEANVIGVVIKDLKKEGFKDILVVDDCSDDKTKEFARKSGAKVLVHPINRGAGAATSTGIEYARRNNYDLVIIMDSDGQHMPKDAKKLIKYSDKYDVVLGSRLLEIQDMPVIRRIANFVGSIVTWTFFGLYVKDSQSGFKVFNKKAIKKIKITFDRYEFCSEIIGEIYKNKLSHIEVPIKVKYTHHSLNKKNSGQSISNGFRMIMRFVFKG